METIDLRKTQCPISLVTLKRYLLLHNEKQQKSGISEVFVLFSTESAMQDIILYLDKKGYDYSTNIEDNNISLFLQLNKNKR